MAKYEDELALKDSVSDKLDKITNKFNILSGKSEKIKNAFGSMAKGIIKATGISVTSIGALALSCSRAARDAEELKSTMDLLTGSSEKSKKIFEDLDKEVGIFSRQTLRGLSVQMLDNGVSTEKLIPTLRMLEGFSMGSTDTLKKLTTQLTKVSANGRVTAESLRALSAVGIDGQKEMQKQLGVTPKLFNKLLAAGRITFTDYERLLTRVYNSTDKYNQSLEKYSNTVNGKFDILRNKVGVLGARLRESLGNIALPYLEKIAEKMTDWVNGLNKLPIEKVEKLNEVLKATEKLFSGILWVIKKVGDLLAKLYNIAQGFIGVLTGLATDTKNFATAFNSLDLKDIGSGLLNGDLLDKVYKIQAEQKEEYRRKNTVNYSGRITAIEKIANSQTQQIPSSTTNMTNYFSINGTVREEADINKIGNVIANNLNMKFKNMRSY